MKNEFISVTEKLPEFNEIVCCLKESIHGNEFFIGYLEAKRETKEGIQLIWKPYKKKYGEGYYVEYATHWCSLPIAKIIGYGETRIPEKNFGRYS